MQRLFDSAPRVSLTWIALLRILLGLVFLTTWLINLFNGFYTPDGLLRFFTEFIPRPITRWRSTPPLSIT